MNYIYFLGFLSLGVTFVIATGGIDFSIGPVMFCCALMAGYSLNTYGLPVAVSLVLSILIGVNNCLIPTVDADRIYYKELCSLLEKTRTAIPEIRLILCEPFAFELSAYKSEEERDFVRRRIELTQSCAAYAKIAADRYGALFVPFWRVLAEYVKRCPADSVVWDGIHPTFIGHEIMAAQWYDKVDSSGLFTGQT